MISKQLALLQQDVEAALKAGSKATFSIHKLDVEAGLEIETTFKIIPNEITTALLDLADRFNTTCDLTHKNEKGNITAYMITNENGGFLTDVPTDYDQEIIKMFQNAPNESADDLRQAFVDAMKDKTFYGLSVVDMFNSVIDKVKR